MGRADQARHDLRPGRRGASTAALALALALTLAGCAQGWVGGRSTHGKAAASKPQTRLRGGTAIYALPPSTTTNYIFPFMNAQVLSVANTSYLQYLLYRPLYWFGQGTQPILNTSLSLASPPVFDHTTVTVTLKHYNWSDGQPVTARDVIFWINMMRADAVSDWGAYVPGGFPANVTAVRMISPTVLRLVMARTYSPTWFTYNELSQITPIPQQWDRTAAGPSDCTDKVADCDAVYRYLNSQARLIGGWASSPLWGIVDGPWRLQSATTAGENVFVPNPSYSGPVKPSLSRLVELPFTSETAEYNMLLAGTGEKITVGYLPTVDAPPRPPGQPTGANPVPGYTLDPLYPWGIDFFPLNLQNDTGQGAIFRQLYFRRALQYLMNQAGVIDGPLHGYGHPTVGPVGSFPPNHYLSTKGRQGDPFPYNPKEAALLLTRHGWQRARGRIAACAVPSLCGAGVAAGARLSFEIFYAAGIDWLESEMKQLQANAAQVGIRLSLRAEPFNSVVATASNCKVVPVSCAWQIGNWGAGWTFVPDYYPTGETVFANGSAANSSGYNDHLNDVMIQKTLTSSRLRFLYEWQDYLSTQVPVIWQPTAAYELTEIAGNLRGVIPQSPTLSINPENWYYVG